MIMDMSVKGGRVKCIVTGEEKYFTPSVLQKKINKFGSMEAFERFYICKPAIKLLKKGIAIEEIRRQLKSSALHQVDIEVLYKLKLFGKRKRGTALSSEQVRIQEKQSQDNERIYNEHKEKMSTCLKTWVEWATGGPNKAQVPYGGTCIRPDLYYDNNGSCGSCSYYEYCLCRNKNR
jgi:hypothetical protein